MPCRILIIEDNPANRQLMAYLLRAFGHTVLSAGDGQEGLEATRRELPELIICDVQLPKLDGYAVARALKADPTLCAIPLVAVTALAMVGDRDRVLAVGFDGYLAKPIAPRTFVSQVEAFLPAEQHSLPHLPTIASESAPQRAKHATILVVDNTLVNIELARSTLEPFGYQIVAARGVQDALALARQAPPDLILSDLHMPGDDGYAFIQAVKADPQLQSIPFVFVSSSVWREKDRGIGLGLGAARFLLRPIAPQQLLAEIAACLRERGKG
jgi:two-component system cell cycle response regulator